MLIFAHQYSIPMLISWLSGLKNILFLQLISKIANMYIDRDENMVYFLNILKMVNI